MGSKGKSSKTIIERPDINWRESSNDGSSLILSIVKEAATLAPIVELKKAACTALLILKTTQKTKRHTKYYERLGSLGYDSSGLIVAIWCSYKKAKDPEEWLSAGMRDILEDLSHTLENICSFVNERLSKNKVIRVLFSRVDSVKINIFREHLNYAMQKFELQCHININDVLERVLMKSLNDQQILHRIEEDEVKHDLEIKGREAQDREIAEKFQEDWETRIAKNMGDTTYIISRAQSMGDPEDEEEDDLSNHSGRFLREMIRNWNSKSMIQGKEITISGGNLTNVGNDYHEHNTYVIDEAPAYRGYLETFKDSFKNLETIVNKLLISSPKEDNTKSDDSSRQTIHSPSRAENENNMGDTSSSNYFTELQFNSLNDPPQSTSVFDDGYCIYQTPPPSRINQHPYPFGYLPVLVPGIVHYSPCWLPSWGGWIASWISWVSPPSWIWPSFL